MQIDAVENALLSATVNPLLRYLINLFDKECSVDGSLLLNSLKDYFEEIWDNHPFLWSLRTRECLEDYEINGKIVGCGSCKDRYICGGSRARAYCYFGGNAKAPDIGYIQNKSLWVRIVQNKD
jgi:MoaA/NifB/PqqE/SkfB family radical SAM enzyme